MTEVSNTALARSALTLLGATKLSSAVARTILPAIRDNVRDFDDFVAVVRTQLPNFPVPTRADWSRATSQLQKHVDEHISVIPFGDARYPPYLATLADAPTLLFAKGDVSCLSRLPGVAIVGTREASEAGIKIAERIAERLSSRGWSVVSGLALGIDAAAHRGALVGGAPTIAVLAHGLEKANPPRNAELGQRILDAGGLWVSEHPLGRHPKPQYFVDRNRIQIGLSAGSIIVEGQERSGTITQAQFCVREGRPLFAVIPQTPDNRLGLIDAGPTMLVRKFGAVPVRSAADYVKVEEILALSRSKLQGHTSSNIAHTMPLANKV